MRVPCGFVDWKRGETSQFFDRLLLLTSLLGIRISAHWYCFDAERRSHVSRRAEKRRLNAFAGSEFEKKARAKKYRNSDFARSEQRRAHRDLTWSIGNELSSEVKARELKRPLAQTLPLPLPTLHFPAFRTFSRHPEVYSSRPSTHNASPRTAPPVQTSRSFIIKNVTNRR